MASVKFSKDYLQNVLNLPHSGVIVDKIIEMTRWSAIHEIIFEDKGKFYRTTYSEGATECQDERPWEYEDEIECSEVVLKEVVVKKWVDVDFRKFIRSE